LLIVLQQMTGAVWKSAFVAALFAVHPLHVESVAWIAERKDVLSTFFGLLSFWAYARYFQAAECRSSKSERKPKSAIRNPTSDPLNPKPGIHGSGFTVQSSRSPALLCHPSCSLFYLLSLLFFALGLMSKPMLVTLPFI